MSITNFTKNEKVFALNLRNPKKVIAVNGKRKSINAVGHRSNTKKLIQIDYSNSLGFHDPIIGNMSHIVRGYYAKTHGHTSPLLHVVAAPNFFPVDWKKKSWRQHVMWWFHRAELVDYVWRDADFNLLRLSCMDNSHIDAIMRRYHVQTYQHMVKMLGHNETKIIKSFIVNTHLRGSKLGRSTTINLANLNFDPQLVTQLVNRCVYAIRNTPNILSKHLKGQFVQAQYKKINYVDWICDIADKANDYVKQMSDVEITNYEKPFWKKSDILTRHFVRNLIFEKLYWSKLHPVYSVLVAEKIKRKLIAKNGGFVS
jgi:hypothetical protein